MKKTIMALCLALCASVVFAQMPRSVKAPAHGTDAKVSAKSEIVNQKTASYKGSIFSKTLLTESFATTNDITITYNQNPGYQSAPYSRWNRIADTSQATLASATNIFPVLFGGANGGQTGFRTLNGFDSQTPTDGLMVMSMQDQISGWGGSGTIGKFESSIVFPSVNPGSATALDVNFYQYYRVFNRDSCFVDYSTDGANWTPIYINVRGLELAGNSSTLGSKAVSVPVPQGATDMYVRIRWKADTNIGNAYGYYWMIDDVEIDATPTSRLDVLKEAYIEGNYQIIPKDMAMPALTWYADVRNTGTAMQENTVATIDQLGGSTISTTQTANFVFAPNTDTLLITDNNGWVLDDWWDGGSNTRGTAAALPRTTVGTNKVYAKIVSDSLTVSSGKAIYFDTIAYVVNDKDANDSSYIWAHDNGNLSNNRGWHVGLTPDGYVTTDETEANVGEDSYMMRVAYRTPSTVPANWVIRGVEIVPAPAAGYVIASAQINPDLTWDSTYVNGGSTYIHFNSIMTGAPTYTVQSTDIPVVDTMLRLSDNYEKIRIRFPLQPTLEADKVYRVGYQINGTTTFTPAVATSNYIDSYQESQQMPDNFNRYFGLYNAQNIIYSPQAQDLLWCGNYGIPMVRMIVGPRMNIPNFNLTFNVTPANSAAVYADDATQSDVTGQTISVAQGTAYPVIIVPDFENGWDLVDIKVNGTSVDMNNDVEAQSDYYTYTVPAISGATTVEVICDGSVGINNADNATIKLQPNPASSSARMTIDGVNGDVNFALIDMNGRVINEKVINANSVETIDLNGLARGTYFVRITNNHLTKVEKLIVR